MRTVTQVMDDSIIALSCRSRTNITRCRSAMRLGGVPVTHIPAKSFKRSAHKLRLEPAVSQQGETPGCHP